MMLTWKLTSKVEFVRHRKCSLANEKHLRSMNRQDSFHKSVLEALALAKHISR